MGSVHLAVGLRAAVLTLSLQVLMSGLLALAAEEAPPANRDGDREGPFTHHFVRVTRTLRGAQTDVTFHYVTAGDPTAEPVVFLHGVPDSWWLFHRPMEALSATHYAIAFDLKGFGQSSKPWPTSIYPEKGDPGGDYSREAAGDEVVAALDRIGVSRFNLVTHDWGSWVGAIMADRWSDRILRYVKAQSTVGVHEPRHVPQYWIYRRLPRQMVAHLEANRDRLVESVYGDPPDPLTFRRTLRVVPDSVVARVKREFPSEAIRAYLGGHCALPEPYDVMDSQIEAFAGYPFPTLLLQGPGDPAQPVSYFDGSVHLDCRTRPFPWGPFPWGRTCVAEPGGKPAERYFPDARLEWIAGAGHFTPHEAPEAFTEAVMRFLAEPARRSAPIEGGVGP